MFCAQIWFETVLELHARNEQNNKQRAHCCNSAKSSDDSLINVNDSPTFTTSISISISSVVPYTCNTSWYSCYSLDVVHLTHSTRNIPLLTFRTVNYNKQSIYSTYKCKIRLIFLLQLGVIYYWVSDCCIKTKWAMLHLYQSKKMLHG
jgi:hypothetical protein